MEPIVMVTKAVDAVLSGQVRLRLARFRQAQIVEAEIGG